jgi:hypothetical protein
MTKSNDPQLFMTGLTRRQLLAGAGGAAGLAAGLQASGANAAVEMTLDLDDPEDNIKGLIKLQADLSGKDAIGGFGGSVWGWVPGEGNTLLFNTYGIGASHVERVDGGWRFYHREILYYLDPKTNEILQEWTNPYTTQTVEVRHIINDPVNRFYALEGGPFPAPYPYEIHDDHLVFRISVFGFRPSPMPRADYPLHSQDDMYQSSELWGMHGSLSEVMNPEVSSASCVTSWSRVSQWIPFMEMGNRQGVMAFHSTAFKMMNGLDDIPRNILAYTEKNHPIYLESPKEWQGMRMNESQVTETKKEIDSRWQQEGPAGPVFEK